MKSSKKSIKNKTRWHKKWRSLPGSKKTMAFKQANSESSIWTSFIGCTSSSRILLATRPISTSGVFLGMMASFPSSSTSLTPKERLATPIIRCSPACALSSATCKQNLKLEDSEKYYVKDNILLYIWNI